MSKYRTVLAAIVVEVDDDATDQDAYDKVKEGLLLGFATGGSHPVTFQVEHGTAITQTEADCWWIAEYDDHERKRTTDDTAVFVPEQLYEPITKFTRALYRAIQAEGGLQTAYERGEAPYVPNPKPITDLVDTLEKIRDNGGTVWW